jgi:hypothetical protein
MVSPPRPSGLAFLLAVSALAGTGPARSGAAPPPEPPAVAERFPTAVPSQVLVVQDVASGDPVRASPEEAAREEPFPLGGLEHVFELLGAIDEGLLDPGDTFPCDSTCWAAGGHGEVTGVSALAWSCDSFFPALARRAGERALAGAASRAARDAGLGDRRVDGRPAATVDEVAGFWRALVRGRLPFSDLATAQLLAAAGNAVHSPRGTARALDDSRSTVRALPVAAGDGAWVVGEKRLANGRRWVFALRLGGGDPRLATVRADELLRETLRAFSRSTRERGGEPWPLEE